jgi:hypothetical protein
MIPPAHRLPAPFLEGPQKGREGREETTMDITIIELDYRNSGAFEVSLLWHRDLEAVSLIIRDSRSCRSLELPVAHDRALHAFKHPFAYAATIGVDCGAS